MAKVDFIVPPPPAEPTLWANQHQGKFAVSVSRVGQEKRYFWISNGASWVSLIDGVSLPHVTGNILSVGTKLTLEV